MWSGYGGKTGSRGFKVSVDAILKTPDLADKAQNETHRLRRFRVQLWRLNYNSGP